MECQLTNNIDNNIFCPVCECKGRSVKSITIESLVKKERLEKLDDKNDFQFCSSNTCDVVYFHSETEKLIKRADLFVSVGQKETEPSRKICYCFDYCAEDIEKDVRASGSSDIPDVIAEKCRNGQDQCAEKNPQGTCCLGNVQEVLNKAKSLSVSSRETDNKSFNASALAQIGALLTAILASACCWVPLLLVGLGISAGSLSFVFEGWRPVMLPITFALLIVAYYFSFRNAEGDCCSTELPENTGGDCCEPVRKKSSRRKINQVIFWLVTAFVLAVSFYPNSINSLTNDSDRIVISLEGVKSQKDALAVEESLLKTKGVVLAEVDLTTRQISIKVKSSEKVSNEQLLLSIKTAGKYSGVFPDQIKWMIKIEGMTCDGCSNIIKSEVLKLKGIYSASVSYENGQANISTNQKILASDLKKAVESVGFKVLSISNISID